MVPSRSADVAVPEQTFSWSLSQAHKHQVCWGSSFEAESGDGFLSCPAEQSVCERMVMGVLCWDIKDGKLFNQALGLLIGKCYI